jgi:putative heme degradation protein
MSTAQRSHASAPALRTGAPLEPGAGWELLARAAQDGLPLVLSAGGPALAWSHTGAIDRLTLHGRWLCLRSGGTELRLDEEQLVSAHFQFQADRHGLRHTLRLALADGSWLDLADAAEPGGPETCAWRQLVQSLWPVAQPARAACLGASHEH